MVLIESNVEGSKLTIKTPDNNSVQVDLKQVLLNNIVRRAE